MRYHAQVNNGELKKYLEFHFSTDDLKEAFQFIAENYDNEQTYEIVIFEHYEKETQIILHLNF